MLQRRVRQGIGSAKSTSSNPEKAHDETRNIECPSPDKGFASLALLSKSCDDCATPAKAKQQ